MKRYNGSTYFSWDLFSVRPGKEKVCKLSVCRHFLSFLPTLQVTQNWSCCIRYSSITSITPFHMRQNSTSPSLFENGTRSPTAEHVNVKSRSSTFPASGPGSTACQRRATFPVTEGTATERLKRILHPTKQNGSTSPSLSPTNTDTMPFRCLPTDGARATMPFEVQSREKDGGWSYFPEPSEMDK